MTKTALINCIIITVNAQNEVIRKGTLLLDNNTITEIGDTSAISIPEGTHIIDGKDRIAVLPGLIDTHTHSSLLKGYSENLPFLEWLPVYQQEHKVLTEEDAYYAYLISYLEALKGGTTCVLDMYRFMHMGAKAAGLLGLRCNLAPYTADNLKNTFFETLDANEDLIKKHHESHQGLIRICIGLEHLFYCTEKAYERAKALSHDYDVFIHTHSSEFEEEVAAVVRSFGKRPIHVLHERGILGPQTIIAHCVWLNDDEIQLFREYDVRVAHCPTSNVKLGGGTLNLNNFLDNNIKVGLGTDGSISNNSLSMWELMKFGSLLQKNLHKDATALNATEVLRLATIEGAKVLGLDQNIGSLEVGKKADFITVDLWQPHLLPILPTPDHDPVLWNLVYAGRASDVKDVWVNGRHVIHKGKSTMIDEDDLLEKTQHQVASLLQRRAHVQPTTFIA